MMRAITYFSNSGDQDVISYYRCYGPAEFLGLQVINGVENKNIKVDRVNEGDLVILERDFARNFTEYEDIIKQCRIQNKPIILDMDDLFFEIPSEHPDNKRHTFVNALLPTYQALNEVDLVTVSTPELRSYFHPYIQNIEVLPNFLNDKLWRLLPPGKRVAGDSITIGYMGGHTHEPDLLLVLTVIQKLLARYPSKIKFQFWGIKPPEEIANHPQVSWEYPDKWNYPEFVEYFQGLKADICIAPLVNNLFSSCKSSIKFLEYSALGVPCVCSAAAPYSRIVEHGKNGYLAASESDWEQFLTTLIENPDIRHDLAVAAQATITRDWLLSKQAFLWSHAFEQAIQYKPSRDATDKIFTPIIGKIIPQWIEKDRDLTHQLAQKSQRLAEQDEQIKAITEQLRITEVELTGIKNSKTWKAALRLRRLRESLIPPDSWILKSLKKLLKR